MFGKIEINKIKNVSSRKNFEYVLQSYYSGNYKASILLLYNIVVNDLYEKLQLMNEKNYINCKKELEEIENILKDGDAKKYSSVEEKIFDVYKDKKVLNQPTIDLLYFFKEVRNKCAHPFFFKESEYSPIEEEVYLFIVRIYNEILIIDAFLKDPYSVMKDDIENFKFPDIRANLVGASSLRKDTDKVKKYFEVKYFRFMTNSNFKKLFKTLLDLTISKKTDEIQKEQYKNFLILNSMLEYLKVQGKENILNNTYNWSKLKSDILYDDDNDIFSDEWFALSYLYKVLMYNSNFVEELKSTNEIVYNKVEVSLYQKGNLFIEFWQLFDYDINVAIGKLKDDISSLEYSRIIDKLQMQLEKGSLLQLLKRMVEKIPAFDGYDIANNCLTSFIKVLSVKRDTIQQEDLEDIFSLFNENRQIYDKTRSNRDNQMLEIAKLGYDLSEYPNLIR